MNDQQAAGEAVIRPSPDTGLPTHSDDGVDLTLIRWMLSLTPAERLQVLEDHVESILSIRHATTDR
jgi:hypothetical protein